MKDLLAKLKNATPVIAGDLDNYLDADDEMQMIADHIRKNNEHNSYVQPDRIKFLYSPKPK